MIINISSLTIRFFNNRERKHQNLLFVVCSSEFLRLSAGRGCSAQTDVPFLNWRLKAEGQTGFFHCLYFS